MAKTAINNPYDVAKVDAIRHYLQLLADNNLPHNYQIFIDDFKAVPKTDKVEMFDTYKAFISDDSRKLQIKTFIGESNTNDEHNFYFQPVIKSDTQGLSGIEVQKHIEEQVQIALDKKERESLEKQVADLKAQSEIKDAMINKLTQDSDELKAKHSGLAGFGELINIFKPFIPGQDSQSNSGPLAGNQRQREEEPVTYARDNGSETLSKEAKIYMRFVEEVQANMDQEQIEDFQHLLNHLKDHPEKIKVIKSLL